MCYFLPKGKKIFVKNENKPIFKRVIVSKRTSGSTRDSKKIVSLSID